MQKVQRKDKAEKEDVGWWTEIRNGEEQNLLGKNKYFRGKGQKIKKDPKETCNETKSPYVCRNYSIATLLLNILWIRSDMPICLTFHIISSSKFVLTPYKTKAPE